MGDMAVDEWEAAQREERGEAPTVDYLDRTWTLPVLMPWSLIEVNFSPTDGKVRAAMIDLLGDQYEDFVASSASTAAVMHILTHAHEVYGVSDPKSEGSEGPSEPDSATLKRSTRRPTTGT